VSIGWPGGWAEGSGPGLLLREVPAAGALRTDPPAGTEGGGERVLTYGSLMGWDWTRD